MKRNNLKSLLAAYRTTMDNAADIIAMNANDIGLHPDDRSHYGSMPMMKKIIEAVVADMRAEDEAAAKSAQKAAEVSGPPRA